METVQSKTNKKKPETIWEVYLRECAQRKLRKDGRNIEPIIRIIADKKKPDFNMLERIIKNDFIEVFRNVLQEDESLAHLKNSHGTTLLMRSVELGNLEALRVLINLKCDLNETDDRGITALHIAVGKKADYFIELLLKEKAAVNNNDNESLTSLLLALEDRNNTIYHLLPVKFYLEIESKRIRSLIFIKISAIHEIELIQNLLSSELYAELIDVADEFGKTPLMHACAKGYSSLTKILLNKRASMDIGDEHGKTALMYACEKGKIKIAEILFDYKASMDARDKCGRDAFFFAALNGKTPIIELFNGRDYYLEDVNLTEKFGLNYPNALFAAFENHGSNLQLMHELISTSSKDVLNHSDLQGNTLLHLAVERKNFEIIIMLINHEVNTEKKNTSGEIPFDIAIKNDYFQAAKLFVNETNESEFKIEVDQFRKKRKKLLWDVYERESGRRKRQGDGRNIDRIISMIARGKKPNFNMMWEIMETNLNQVFRYLLEEDFSLLHLKDPHGTTLPIKSVELGNLEALRVLLEWGSPVNEADNAKFTALHYAVSRQSESFVEVLMGYGADVNKKANDSTTPLLLALKGPNSTICQLLLGKIYRNIKSKRIRGLILIRVAAMDDKKLLGNLLIFKKYVDQIDAVDDSGKTALMCACEKGHKEIAEMLIEKKASMIIRDKQGRDAFFLAALNGRASIIGLFYERGYRLENINLSEEFGLNYPNALFAAFENTYALYASTTHLYFKWMHELISKSSKDVLNCSDLHGNTLLHLAVERKNYDIIGCIIKVSKYEEIENTCGRSPFDIAVNNSDIKSAELLIKSHYSLQNNHVLEESIKKGNNKFVFGLLKCGYKVKQEHLDSAIESGRESLVNFDERTSEQKYIEDLWFSVFGLLLNKTNLDHKQTVSKAVERAIDCSNYQFLCQSYNSEFKTIFINKINEIYKIEKPSSEVLAFLQRFPEFKIKNNAATHSNYNLFHDNDYLNRYSIQDIMTNSPLKYEFYEFLYTCIKFKIDSRNLNEISFKGTSILEFAIKYFKMDSAMAALTFEVGPKVERQFQDIIETKFNTKFNQLYKEFTSNGSGLKTLEEFARIAARCDIQGFERIQHDKYIRKILLFDGPYFYQGIINVDLESVLNWLSKFEDDHGDAKGIAILVMSEIIDVLVKSTFSSTTENKIFMAINQEKCDNLKKLLSSENYKFRDLFIGEIYALHYAIALGNKEIVECLVDFGCPNLCTWNRLFTCVDIAEMFEHFSVSEYLSTKSRFKDGKEDYLLRSFFYEDILEESIEKFLLELFAWKSKGFGVNYVLSNGKLLLEVAIQSGREDIAAVLLQNGTKHILEEKFINSISRKCSEDFIRLYTECRINGSKGLNLTLFKNFLRIHKIDLQPFKIECDLLEGTFIEEIFIKYFSDGEKLLQYKQLLAIYDKSLLKSLFHILLPSLRSYNSRYKLYEFIQSGDLNNVNEFIRLKKVNVNKFYAIDAYTGEELNILHYSIVIGNIEVFKLILQNGGVNLKTRRNLFSCVELAELFGHPHIAQYLSTLPQYCVIPTNSDLLEHTGYILERLLEYSVNDFLKNGKSILQTSVEEINENIATLLLQKGANPILSHEHETIIRSKFSLEFNNLYDECRCSGSQTLQHLSRIAARKNLALFNPLWKYRCFRPILEYKSKFYCLDEIKDENIYENYSHNLLPELLLNTSITEHIKLWNVHYSNDSLRSHPLFSAIKEQNVKEIRSKIKEQKINVNSFHGYDIRNPFHYAIILGNLDIVKLLLEYGALERPMLTNDSYFKGPIYCAELAEMFGHFEIVKLLSTRRGFRPIKTETELKFLNYYYSILERMKESPILDVIRK